MDSEPISQNAYSHRREALMRRFLKQQSGWTRGFARARRALKLSNRRVVVARILMVKRGLDVCLSLLALLVSAAQCCSSRSGWA